MTRRFTTSAFTPVRHGGYIQRLPILDPDDPNAAPPWVRERYGGRRCVIAYDSFDLTQGDLVAGGPAPPPHHHPPDPPLRGAFTYTPAQPAAGQEITLNAKASSGRIDRYEWWEIMSDERAVGMVARFTFPTPGRKTMLLTVTGPGGRHQGGQYVDVAEA